MLDDKNNSIKTQVFTHHKHGRVMRKFRQLYFRPVNNIDIKYMGKTVEVDPAMVKNNMVRTECKRDKHTRVMCAGCGKMFSKIDMDKTLCRGYDGCSIKAELDEVTIYNTLPFDGTGIPA